MSSTIDPEATLIRVLTDPSVIADPYADYARIREHAPLFRAELADMWVLSRYDDIRTLLRSPRAGSGAAIGRDQRRGVDGGDRRARDPDALSMLFLNPPDHTRIRGLVSRAFTPKRVEQLRPEVTAMAAHLLDELGPAGDFVDKVAFPLPANVISALVGVPESDRDWLRPLIFDLGVGIEPTASADEVARADAAAEEVGGYLRELIAHRRNDPRDDLLSALIEASDDRFGDQGARLTEQEVVSNTVLIYAAGFETTTHLLGNMVRALVAHPDQLRRVQADPSLVPGVVEEVLRFDPPVQIDGRFLFDELEVSSGVLPQGSSVLCLLGAANRDPAVFGDPDRFDVGRSVSPVMSFGSGIHYCLGAALARLEGQVLLEELMARYRDWAITAEPTWRPRVTLRGVEGLDVAFG